MFPVQGFDSNALGGFRYSAYVRAQQVVLVVLHCQHTHTHTILFLREKILWQAKVSLAPFYFSYAGILDAF